jgi:ATP-binding cassette subfamily F protein 3
MKGLNENEKGQAWKVEKILSGLGFSREDMYHHPGEFSGGFQIRLNLAKVLASEPDLLLLDEPANYLDITSIRWIERFLVSWPHELMLITHDRSFMDKVITHTLGIHRNKLRKIAGSTEKYYSQIAQDEEVHEKTRINDERKRKEIELFISRFRSKARLANLVQSRIKTLAKQDRWEKIEKIKTLDFAFREKPYLGKYVLTAQDISFAYEPGRRLINGFDITIGAHDRICIVGKNGKGKTTLLKLLAGDLNPQRGEVIWNKGVGLGFFEQTNISQLTDARTVEEEILSSHADVDRQTARNICGAMLFEGDHALKKIAVLSGGEKSRVMLGKLLATPVNLLLLDEPTNHLDMESSDALLAALDSFEGAVAIVTHNEMFLYALSERLIVFQNEGISVFEGGYQAFLERGGWGDEEEALKEAPPDKEDSKLNKKEFRRLRSEIISERSRVMRPLEQRRTQVEQAIEAFEDEINDLHAAIHAATLARDGKKIADLSLLLQDREKAVDALLDELEQVERSLEEQKTSYDERLQLLVQPGDGDVRYSRN